MKESRATEKGNSNGLASLYAPLNAHNHKGADGLYLAQTSNMYFILSSFSDGSKNSHSKTIFSDQFMVSAM